MTPLIPRGRGGWEDDPGHIRDAPAPTDEPEVEVLELPVEEHQDHVGTDIPVIDSITAKQAAEETRPLEGEPAPVPEIAEVEVPRALAQEIRRAMKRYPEKRSASIPALWAVQRRYGYCSPEGINQAAAVMGMTPAYLQSVASFYDLFHLEPQGDHEVLVCTNISCWLRGGDDLLDSFMEAAGVDHAGTTSEDGKVFVRGFECLGACDLAPMASIDERYYGPLEPGDAADAVEQLRSRKPVLPDKALQEREAAGGVGPRVGTDARVTRHSLNKVTQKRATAKKAAAKKKPAAKRKPTAKKKAAARRKG
jgi:NADH-quinone oxidoreductase subunit E